MRPSGSPPRRGEELADVAEPAAPAGGAARGSAAASCIIERRERLIDAPVALGKPALVAAKREPPPPQALGACLIAHRLPSASRPRIISNKGSAAANPGASSSTASG